MAFIVYLAFACMPGESYMQPVGVFVVFRVTFLERCVINSIGFVVVFLFNLKKFSLYSQNINIYSHIHIIHFNNKGGNKYLPVAVIEEIICRRDRQTEKYRKRESRPQSCT